VHIGINPDKLPFKIRKAPSHNENIIFLMCANFVEKKGIPYAIKAFSEVYKKYKDIELRIIGDGKMRKKLESLIDKLKLNSKVKLLGYQPHSEFVKEAMNAHIFLAPSITAQNGDTEGGAPTVLIEAQAMGMPVIATRHADIPEVVINEKTGLLSKERDVVGLADNMIALIEEPSLLKEFGEAGREHIRSNYNIKTICGFTEDIYERIS
ncbi:MAG: glycosyltransferase, partial [Candidatus Margulisbacteria bacterium]|nr:glycosyltransferase [Candidatus Margulisiibacteriota bacterium]